MLRLLASHVRHVANDLTQVGGGITVDTNQLSKTTTQSISREKLGIT